MIRRFFLGFIRTHVLYHASKEAICGIDMIRELKGHGYSVSPGLIYPMLHSLEREGYLIGEQKVVRGKARRYYRLTDKGMTMLKRSREKIRELVEEVMR
ncbi:MAG: PadR family transcriptional regulator [Nitrososphaerales archaeon]